MLRAAWESMSQCSLKKTLTSISSGVFCGHLNGVFSCTLSPGVPSSIKLSVWASSGWLIMVYLLGSNYLGLAVLHRVLAILLLAFSYPDIRANPHTDYDQY